MKKVVLLLCVLFLVSCQLTPNSGNDNKNEHDLETILKVKQRGPIATVYHDKLFENKLDILSAEEIIDVQEVYIKNDLIDKYKVTLKYGQVGYVDADEFYIIDTFSDTYKTYLTPSIDIKNIKFKICQIKKFKFV